MVVLFSLFLMKLRVPESLTVITVNHPKTLNHYPKGPCFPSHPTLKPKVNEQKKKP